MASGGIIIVVAVLSYVSLSVCLWSSESKRVEVIIATRFAAPDIGAYYHLYYGYILPTAYSRHSWVHGAWSQPTEAREAGAGQWTLLQNILALRRKTTECRYGKSVKTTCI